MTSRVRILAPAKVNLTLEVLGRRADGYHDLASVMATVGVFDDVRIGAARALDVRVRPPLDVDGGEDLAARAVRAMAGACGREPSAHVLVRKRIPIAAGLGGGSSDAAAVLRALAALWGAAVDLVALAATVGSDVPFFAAAAPIALVGGRGERVEPIPAPREPLWIALVRLPARASTREVFAALGDVRGEGRATAEVAGALADRRATPEMLRGLARNDLMVAAESVCPPIAEARKAARARGIELALSGSGPSLFAIADDRAHAIRLARSLTRAGLRARPRVLAVEAPLARS